MGELARMEDLLSDQQKEMVQQVAGLGSGGGIDVIRLDNGHFVFPDGRRDADKLRVVVVDWGFSHLYYDSEYVPGESAFPACFAVGKDVREMKPSNNAPEPQNDICATCPQNQFGSGRGNAKACQNRITLICTLSSAKEEGANTELFKVGVSPTAIKNWRKLATQMTEKGLLPVQLVTELTFNQQAKYDQLVFRAVAKNPHVREHAQLIPAAREAVLFEPSPRSDEEEE